MHLSLMIHAKVHFSLLGLLLAFHKQFCLAIFHHTLDTKLYNWEYNDNNISVSEKFSPIDCLEAFSA